jgi:hypothetical protein
MISIVGTVVFLVMLFNAFWYKRTSQSQETHQSIVDFSLPKVARSEKGKAALYSLLGSAESSGVDEFEADVAVSRDRLKLNTSWVMLLPLIGVPTHHSKAVAFQTPATPILEGIVDLHHDIMLFLVFIIVFVLYLLTVVVVQFTTEGEDNIHGYAGDNVVHSTPLEIIWTIIPTVILLFIALPSFVLLYSMDEQFDPVLTLKVIGRQWY